MKKTYTLADIPKAFSRVRREVAAAMKENEKITYMNVTDNSIRVHLFDGNSNITVISAMIHSPYSRPSFNKIPLSDFEINSMKNAIEAENS